MMSEDAMAALQGLERIRGREIEQRRKNMLYVILMLLAFAVVVGSLVSSYA
jgi:hypothetical protein